jgi:hypothetical protein
MSPQAKRNYLKGAVSGREFLRRTQTGLRLHRQFEPKMLRWEFQIHIRKQSAEYQAGFIDAIGAYMMTTLEGVLVDLYRWEVLRVLEEASQKK